MKSKIVEKMANRVSERAKIDSFWNSLSEEKKTKLSIIYFNNSNYNTLSYLNKQFIYNKQNNHD